MIRLLFIAGLLLALPLSGGANSIYKYRDAAGVWHYTDERPRGTVAVQTLDLGTEPAPAAPARQVGIEKRGDDGAPVFYAVNRHLAPVEVRFWLTESANLGLKKDVPLSVVVPPMGERRIVALTPVDADRPTDFRYQYRWQLGDPAAHHDTAFAYLPPVPLSGNFTISQAFDGGFSHNTPGSRHAIDIPLPEGTPVMAARAGRVISVRMDSNQGGNSPRYRSKANTIYLQHADGTYAVYAHLRHRSALVAVGDQVEAGQIIAQSGNTGYSTAPHLHFAILRNAGLRWESQPFQLAMPGGAVTPKVGLALNDRPAVPPTLVDPAADPSAEPAAFGRPTGGI